MIGGKRGAIFTALLLILASPLYAPQLLAFPYKAATPIGTVWSERPLDPRMLRQTAEQVDSRMRATPLASATERRAIFVTDGGWRWQWLAAGSSGSFALTRPLTKAVVVNRTDPASGRVVNGRPVGGARQLGSVLAHEFTHGLLRRRFGELALVRAPSWKVEGYCDHVAGESSLSATDVARLEAAGADHPALVYYRGRRRVAAELAENGGDVAALFADRGE